MKIFSFLKKKNKKDDVKKNSIEFSEVEVLIEDKKKENEIKEKEIFNFIREKIDILENNLESKIQILLEVNLNQKKSEDRIKAIVEEGRKQYIKSVRLFMHNLKNLKESRLEEIYINLDKFFLEFDKTLSKSYERTTLLIGKEIKEIKDELRSFSKGLIDLLNENKHLIELSKILNSINVNFQKIKGVEKEFEEVENSFVYVQGQIKNKEREKEQAIERIREIEKSEEYLEIKSIEEEVKNLEQNLKEEINNLRQVIDFKKLANFYHIFEDKMNVIKNYREKFKENFERDYGKEILGLLKESKSDTEEIIERINKIKQSKARIIKKKEESGKIKDPTIELQQKIKTANIEIEGFRQEIIKKEKRMETLKETRQDFLRKLKTELEKMDINLRF